MGRKIDSKDVKFHDKDLVTSSIDVFSIVRTPLTSAVTNLTPLN